MPALKTGRDGDGGKGCPNVPILQFIITLFKKPMTPPLSLCF